MSLNTQNVKAYYNSRVGEELHGAYESFRWDKDEVYKEGYIQTEKAIQENALPYFVHIKTIFELGPGPGTWTRLFLTKYADVQMHLVDISEAMLAKVASSLGSNRTTTEEADFSTYQPTKTFDGFFSSRAIEYIPNKVGVAQTIAKILNPNGVGVIITKYPHYIRMWLLGRHLSDFHSGQISPRALSKILSQAGLRVLAIHPVVVVVPLFHSAKFNRFITSLARKLPWWFSAILTESYIMRFQKD